MNIRSLILGLMLTAGLLSGCNDDINYVGGTIQPDKDRVSVTVDSFVMTTSTIRLDSIFAKTSTGFLGEFYDPQFGEYKSDYICQFYCQEDFKFRHEPKDGKIDSVQMFIYIDSYMGDTLSPMKVEAFPVVRSLERNYYTNINPVDYSDMQNSLGGQAYTVYNVEKAKIQDSIRINMNTEVGQRIYDETINNPSSFVDQEAFNKFFPGVYITNTFGMGAVVGVKGTQMIIHYSYDSVTKGSNGQDSAYVANTFEVFVVTDEVIQMNRMKSYGLDELLQPNDNYTYLRTPAGVCTRIVIPAKEIYAKVGDRTINNLPISVRAMPQSDWEFATGAPGNLLLLPEDSLKTFFENKKIDDNITSYKAAYSVSSTDKVNIYDFTNIARLLNKHKENAPEEDLRLLLVPISVKYSSSSTTTSSTYTISHFQAPSGVVLRKDPDVMKLKVTSSLFNK